MDNNLLKLQKCALVCCYLNNQHDSINDVLTKVRKFTVEECIDFLYDNLLLLKQLHENREQMSEYEIIQAAKTQLAEEKSSLNDKWTQVNDELSQIGKDKSELENEKKNLKKLKDEIDNKNKFLYEKEQQFSKLEKEEKLRIEREKEKNIEELNNIKEQILKISKEKSDLEDEKNKLNELKEDIVSKHKQLKEKEEKLSNKEKDEQYKLSTEKNAMNDKMIHLNDKLAKLEKEKLEVENEKKKLQEMKNELEQKKLAEEKRKEEENAKKIAEAQEEERKREEYAKLKKKEEPVPVPEPVPEPAPEPAPVEVPQANESTAGQSDVLPSYFDIMDVIGSLIIMAERNEPGVWSISFSVDPSSVSRKHFVKLIEFVSNQKNPNIKEIDVRGCNISSMHFKKLCEALKTNPYVTTIDVSRNGLSSEDLKNLVELVKTNRVLETIKAAQSDTVFISEKVEKSLFEAIKENPVLLNFGFYFRPFTRKNVDNILFENNRVKNNLKYHIEPVRYVSQEEIALFENGRRIYPLERLQRYPLPEGVGEYVRENFLSDGDFFKLFKMIRTDFEKLHEREQNELKKQYDLL